MYIIYDVRIYILHVHIIIIHMMYFHVQLFAKIDHDSIQNDTSLQKREFPHSKVCVCVCVCAHVRACVRTCMRVCVCVQHSILIWSLLFSKSASFTIPSFLQLKRKEDVERRKKERKIQWLKKL